MVTGAWLSRSTNYESAFRRTDEESQMIRLKEAVAISTAAPARHGRDLAVRHIAVSSAFRQLRQLRQSCLNGCEGSFIMELYGYNRQLRKTLPTLLALPFCSSINHKRTASRRQRQAAVHRRRSRIGL